MRAPLNSVARACSRRVGLAFWACLLLPAHAIGHDCGMPGLVVQSFDRPDGRLVPAPGGSGLGFFGAFDGNLDTVRLEGSDALDDTGFILTQGRYFLCTNAVTAPAASTAAVVVLRGRPGRGYLRSDFPLYFGPYMSYDNHWRDWEARRAVDAFRHSVGVRDWLNQSFGMDSFDDSQGSFLASINSYSSEVLNAFYLPHPLGSLVAFTRPRSAWGLRTTATFASAPDVVAHEWVHGVTSAFSDLLIRNEPGALSEAFSDWMGAAFKSLGRDAAAPGRWLLGEGVLVLRDMRNPLRHGDPDTYLGVGWRSTSCGYLDNNDDCHVHVNSGVGNKMFHLLADGGTHNGVRVAGVGMERAAEIAMDAQRFWWSANSGYSDARAGMVDAATAYGAHAKVQTELAWRAVCVDDPLPPPCQRPGELRALRVQATSPAPASASTGMALMRLAVPARRAPPFLSGWINPVAGRIHFLASVNPGLDATGVMADAAVATTEFRTAGSSHLLPFLGLRRGVRYTLYALLHQYGHTPGPLRAVPVSLGEAVPALRAEAVWADGGGWAMRLASGMDGTAVHLVLPASAGDAPASAQDLLAHPDARAQAVAAGSGAALAWGGLEEGEDYVWHAVVVRTLDAMDDAGAPGVYASARLAAPFRTAPAPTLVMLLSPVRRHVDIVAVAGTEGVVRYLVLPASERGPAAVAELATDVRAREAAVSVGASTLSWTGLAPDTDYAAYAFLRAVTGDSALASRQTRTTRAWSLSFSLSPRRRDVRIDADVANVGVLHYLVLPASERGPADADALAVDVRARTAAASRGTSTLSWTGLEPGVSYAAYAAVHDAKGHSPLETATFDTVPGFALTLSLSPRSKSVGIDASVSTSGVLYYVVYPADLSMPDRPAWLATNVHSRSATVTVGSNALSWPWLQPNRSYAVYAIVRDRVGYSPVETSLFNTAPEIGLTLSPSPQHYRVDLGVDTNAGGVLHYLVLPGGSGSEPWPGYAAQLMLDARTRTATVTVGSNALSPWTGLAPHRGYVFIAVIRGAQSESWIQYKTFRTRRLLWLSLSPGSHDVQIKAYTANVGVLHYLVLPASERGPADADELMIDTRTRTVTATIGDNALSWTGLAPGASYTVYSVVRDAESDAPLVTAQLRTTENANNAAVARDADGAVSGGAVSGGAVSGGGCALGAGDNGIGLLLLWWCLCSLSRRRPVGLRLRLGAPPRHAGPLRPQPAAGRPPLQRDARSAPATLESPPARGRGLGL